MYERRHANRRLLVALNFSAQPHTLHPDLAPGRTLLSTSEDTPAVDRPLGPNEGRVVELAASTGRRSRK
jgi:hypothetical protein